MTSPSGDAFGMCTREMGMSCRNCGTVDGDRPEMTVQKKYPFLRGRTGLRGSAGKTMRAESASFGDTGPSAGAASGIAGRGFLRLSRWWLHGSTVLAGGLVCHSALAQTIAVPQLNAGGIGTFSSTEMIGLSLVIGAISATLLSTLWLVRQRNSIEADSREIRSALSDANQRISRYQALIADKNRRIVIWDGGETKPEQLGQLPVETGAPQTEGDFLAFGRWMKPGSAADLDNAIEKLRFNAQSFDLIVETYRDEVLEVQGRVSGGRAFARFVALNNLRAELAELKIEKTRLSTAIETFESLLESVEQPVWQRDSEGRLVWVNQAYSDAVEALTPDQAIQEGREILNTITREKIRATLTPVSPYHDTVSTVVHGNRTFFSVVDTKTPKGSCGMAIDVSREEALREELSRTLKSHAETLDHLATPVAIFDGERRLQFYNQAFQQLWDLDLAFLESRPDHAELLDRLRSAGKLPEQLSWKAWKENTLSVYRSIDTQTVLWHLPNGQTLRVIASAHPQGGATWVFENLTEQVDLETRYNTLVRVQGETIDHLSEGVAVFGPDGRIRLSNPAFRALWGITETQAAPGTHIRAIEEACALSYEKPDGWRAFGKMITSFEDERPSSQGTIELMSGLVLDYAVIPLPNAQTMLTFVNITDSVRAERALLEKNEALRKADELKNDFVQHISYELRSPLTNIIGFTDLLKSTAIGPLNERQGEYVDHISTSSAVLLTIVNDILDLATVDAGIMRLTYSDIDLTDLLDDVSMQMTDRLQEGGVTLEILAPSHLGDIVADQQRLKQILIKIITNAVNFSPEGAKVVLKCWREDADFVFSVSDTGCGIPEDMLPSVFKRFSSNAKGGKRTGAGLGLSIVESFVHLHNGTVSINSVPNQGTTVLCRIPSGVLVHSVAAE
ncbi:PAS domain-containing protein [Agrobacterium vitis]|uniref:histidine kinase n=2 Tax=Agrobacterium vitis TaxID=373 RepID=A0AAE4WDV7_AGRVI|nr:PAS domain-containing sensor histidine kinase [Agrobacterium vitis]MCF1498371.1 PAS domain-containing protein [Allorhizobium sp. Av2]MCM2440498.1 PAS domain-containing protein [Agrobacterium vitis]MUZ58294.1 PAS domain-containing protein [Agrobacterium vitis]MVA66256.1 PAS domain-containing protein [Agrobacterium vitis]MVA87174.1 PAS domain-containing protein [Agrobacterium vitis]